MAKKIPDRLAEYNAKRDFTKTGEPAGQLGVAQAGRLRFLVQKHAATRLHYDFRLEWDGVLLSWAVTKGPSDDPGEKRLAVRTEDHPLSYGDFEGTIPKGEYGGGTVMLWDTGHWLPEGDVEEGLSEGKLAFTLRGTRMRGEWALIRMRRRGNEKRENWLLVKARDSFAGDKPDHLTKAHVTSVTTGRKMDEIAKGAPEGKPLAPEKPQRKGKRPGFQAPQLATLVAEAPEGDDWIHETKFDGYRCMAALGKGGVRLYTRSGKDWTDTFGALVEAFDPLACDTALIDGEVMARKVGASAFSSLQAALTNGSALVFYAFDLLALDGKDFAGETQLQRREKLADLLKGLPEDGPLRMSAHVVGNGGQVFDAACKAGAEGIISKCADAPYKGRRSRAWLKVKCTRRQEFVVGGYSASDKKGRPFASLLLGENGPDGLRYRGRVGTGFAERDFEALTEVMRERKTSPFLEVPGDISRDAQWVTPSAVVEVEFSEFTEDGHIRHGSYQGLRRDKEASDVTLEVPKEPPVTVGRTQGVKVAGVTISNPDREIFPSAGCTKLDVAQYYERAGPRLVAIAGQRPLSLLRLPTGLEGERFFQKHAGKGFPDALQRVDIEESDGDLGEYLYATRTEAFVSAAQMGTIEFHIWGAKVDRLDRPDRLVFDLDPDEGLDWKDVLTAARDLRARLNGLGLASVPVVTGGKGVHVCVCLRRTQGWETIKLFAKTMAHVMAEDEPERFTATMSKAKRKGRIFIDWLRNERGSTAITPWSVRAREGAPVAVPVTWEELDGLKGADAFRLGGIDARLKADCPYLAALKDLQTLNEATIEKLAGGS